MKKATFIPRIIAAFTLMLFTHTANATATLTWATYFGGTGTDYAYSTCVDGSGNVFLAGNTQSTSAIATAGAYQTTFGGGSWDGYVAKFNSAGALLWSTYFGGSGSEDVRSITTDASGNVYLYGGTNSASGIVTTGAYMTSLVATGTSSNAFLAKFNSAGTLLWATYFGGTGGEKAQRIRTDGAGNVYIVGYTASTSGIATAGAYQTTYAGGSSDAFLAKFSGTGSLLWSSYFGGGGVENCAGVAIDPSGNVFIGGRTNSTSGIATSGAYQTAEAGDYDVFISKFTSSGSIIWATYYGGSGGEGTSGMSCDAAGNIYLTGSTWSASGIATSGAFQTYWPGPANAAFLTKFTGSGSLIWGTYYGGFGSGSDGGSGTAVNSTGDIYMIGTTSSSTGIATPGSIQPVMAGASDAFIVKFNSAGARQWGSYYGGTGVSGDYGTEIATGVGSNVYFSGYTSSATGIATAGAYQTIFAGLGTLPDGFLGVINDPSTSIAPITGTASVCVGSTTTLTDATPGGTWSSGATSIATVGSSSGVVSGVAAGTAIISYTVGSSWATITVTVSAPASATISGATSVCVGLTVTLTGATPGGTWTSIYPSLATVGSSSGIVTGVAVGIDTIKYSLTNACGTVTAKRYISVVTGGSCSANIKHNKSSSPAQADGLRIYPNPNKGTFTLKLESDNAEDATVTITNVVGQRVKEFVINNNLATDVTLSQPQGIYFVAVRTASQTYFAKVQVE